MSIWNDALLPRLIAVACNTKQAKEARARVCASLEGDVIEVGFGSGSNVPFMPGTVSGLWGVDPSGTARKLAAKRIAASSVPVEFAGLDAQTIEAPDDRFDTALSTWSLCTIPDAEVALREIRRVLKPGGTLHFVEHGLAPDEKVRRWQSRIEPIHSRLFGGCRVTRDIPALIKGAGFTIKDLEHAYGKGEPKYAGYTYEGWATA
jgi:ubiquinone/menaquinone biosynthesis C-methylase UbiE